MKSLFCSLLALILAVGMFPGDSEAGRSRCRSCKPAKAKRQYRIRTQSSSVSKSAPTCSGGSCPAPATKTIEKTKTKLKTNDRQAFLQAWAEEECRLQAQAGRVGHFRRTPRGARFVGVGLNGRTCMTSGEPLAVAHFGGYSCRVW